MAPAFVGGFPGGMEIAVLFAVLLSLTLVAVVVVAVGRSLFGGGPAESRDLGARVAALEGGVAELRGRLDDRQEDR
jgi:hypothetical protein